MKRISLILIALAFALTGTAYAKNWKTVRMSSEGAFPPFKKVNKNGKLVGFDIDIGNALCD